MFVADWSQVWTAEQAERELKDFRFSGPGWYLTEKDTVLAVPIDRSEQTFRRARFSKTELFAFYVWNSPSACDALSRALALPVREDGR